jgi:NTP pyrophosphatase (non-canonical NTP hydrolase)
MEELAELAGAIVRQRPEDIEDALGDVLVTLILQAELQRLDLVECLAVAYGRISQRMGKTNIHGVFVKAEEGA